MKLVWGLRQRQSKRKERCERRHGAGAICLVQPWQAAGVVPMVSVLMMGSCYEALASALLSKEKRVG